MNQKKKIVIIGPAHPLRGGLAVFNERMAEVLQNDGHEVIIYSFSLQYPDFLFPGKTQYTDAPQPTHLNIKTKVNSINPFNWIKIGLEIQRLKPDIVIGRFWIPFMGPCFGTILRLIKRNNHTRVIGFVDNIIPHEKRPGDFILAKYFVDSCDAFLVMSKMVETQLRTFTKDKPIALAEHPLSDNFGKAVSYEKALEHLQLSKEYRYLLYFGFIRDYKGLDLLLDAMADDRLKKMKLKLIVAGEFYSNEEKYNAQIAALGVEDQLVMRTEFISNEEVKYYFCAADLITQPYKTATQSGVSSLGYFFEKPMLVTKVGGLPEIVKHQQAGYVVDVNAQAIADSIVDFYENDRSEVFVNQVKIDKKMFSWETMIEAILSLDQ